MSRRPGGAPPPSVPRRSSRVIRPAKTGCGKTGCPLSVLILAVAVTVGLSVGGCGPSKQAERPHPLQTARQHAP